MRLMTFTVGVVRLAGSLIRRSRFRPRQDFWLMYSATNASVEAIAPRRPVEAIDERGECAGVAALAAISRWKRSGWFPDRMANSNT